MGTDLTQYGGHFAALAIWRASNGKLVVPQIDLGTGPEVLAGALAFSRDGKLLAAAAQIATS